MGWSVGFFTSHSDAIVAILGGCCRIALAATTAGLATLGGGWLALGAAGQDAAPSAGARRRRWSRPRDRRGASPICRRCRRPRGRRSVDAGRRRRRRSADDAAAADPGPDRARTRSRRAQPPPPCAGKNPARGGSNAVDKAIALGQRRRAAAAGGARGGQEDHRGRQRHRAHALQVGRRPRQVAGHGLRLLGLGLVRAGRGGAAERAAGLRAR